MFYDLVFHPEYGLRLLLMPPIFDLILGMVLLYELIDIRLLNKGHIHTNIQKVILILF